MQSREMTAELGRAWWVFLITGIFWILVSMVVLRFDLTSLTTVGVLVGVVFLFAGINEFVLGGARASWRWLHYTMGVLFALGAIWAFTSPVEAFWSLAAVLGFLLALKGTFDIIVAVATKPVNELWWLGLTVGILELLLAFWASQRFFPARAELILIWVGFATLFRGFNEIVMAFMLRRARREYETAGVVPEAIA